jgi:hypothetical protein
MRARLFVAAAIAAVGLAGCTQDAAPSGEQPAGSETSETVSSTTPESTPPAPESPAPSGTPDPSGSPGADVPAGATRVPVGQVDADELPSYYAHRGEVWVFGGGRSLRMFAMASSGCTDAEAVVSDQSASEVRITLRALPQPPGNRPGGPDGGVCTQVLTPRPVTVTLAEPLGDRTIHLSAGR